MKRKNFNTQWHKILKLLWDGSPHSAYDIYTQGIGQYNVRIRELRAKGFNIVSESIDGKRRFRLITPTTNIDFDNLKIIKTEQGEIF